MSTNDVPGLNPQNRDELHAGCWAEHTDGTLLYVLGTENFRVVFELFELTDPNNPVEYRDTMNLDKFQKDFSWDPKSARSIKWTWHDKTEFPWHRIVGKMRAGVRAVSADQQIKAAAQVKKTKRKHATRAKSVAQVIARDLKLKPHPIEHADLQHRVEREMPKGGVASRVRNRIQNAINKLKVGG